MKARKSYSQYVDARRNFQLNSELLSEARRSLMEAKVDLSLPKEPIQILEIAEPSEEPISEKAEAALMRAMWTGLLWAIPGGLILMYLAFAFSEKDELLEEVEDEEVDDIGSLPEAEVIDKETPF